MPLANFFDRAAAARHCRETSARSCPSPDRERTQGRSAQIVVEHTNRRIPDHVTRSRYRKGCDRHTAGKRFQHHKAECIGAARKHDTSAAA